MLVTWNSKVLIEIARVPCTNRRTDVYPFTVSEVSPSHEFFTFSFLEIPDETGTIGMTLKKLYVMEKRIFISLRWFLCRNVHIILYVCLLLVFNICGYS